MKGLYRLAVAFEKASQVSTGPVSVDPDRVGPNSTLDPRMQTRRDHTLDFVNKPLNTDVFTHPATPSAIDPKIQSDLIDLGFPLPSRGPDGLLGPETKAAIQAFKKKFPGPNSSPEALYKRIRDEAAKLNGSSNLSFKVQQPAEAGKQPGTPIGPVGDHKVPGNISAEPTPKKNTGDLIKDLQQ